MPTTRTVKVFLASSAELKDDREQFEIFVNRTNKNWVPKGIFVELVIWEDFLDAISQTRLQDEYNKEIRQCELFVMLFWTKVGKYTEEEFSTALGQFQATNKPFVYTYFKTTPPSAGRTYDPSVEAFKQRLNALGHFYTRYDSVEGLKLHFRQQLDKLIANGFIRFPLERNETAPTSYEATLTGDGAIAQGLGARAVGMGGVFVGRDNSGEINTGTKIDTGSGAYFGAPVSIAGDFVGRDQITHGISSHALESLCAPLLSVITQHASGKDRATAVEHVKAIEAEVAKGPAADDKKLARVVNGLVDLVPAAVGSVVSLFATPILGGVAGPVTEFVLERLKGK